MLHCCTRPRDLGALTLRPPKRPASSLHQLAQAALRSPWPAARCMIACALACLAGGCIAPNLPSERYHDPHDRGGLLGGYRGGHSHTAGLHSDAEALHHVVGGGAGCCDEEDGPAAEHGSEKPPEIPWPRYHPVPTRRVF